MIDFNEERWKEFADALQNLENSISEEWHMAGFEDGMGEAAEKFKSVIDAAIGLSKGVDWNKGAHAKKYRPKLLKALEEYQREILGKGEKNG